MGKLSRRNEYGWYGSCGNDECESLWFEQLPHRDKIESIIRINKNGGLGFEKFTAYDNRPSWVNDIPSSHTFDTYINNTFQKLECGMAYQVNVTDVSEDFELDNFHVPTGTSFVSADCSGLRPVPCTADGYINLQVSDIEDSHPTAESHGISATKFNTLGLLSVPPVDFDSTPLPRTLRIKIGDNVIGAITYAGTIGGDIIYFRPSSGDLSGICLEGVVDEQNDNCSLEINT